MLNLYNLFKIISTLNPDKPSEEKQEAKTEEAKVRCSAYCNCTSNFTQGLRLIT